MTTNITLDLTSSVEVFPDGLQRTRGATPTLRFLNEWTREEIPSADRVRTVGIAHIKGPEGTERFDFRRAGVSFAVARLSILEQLVALHPEACWASINWSAQV
jgi:hypothetical protein